MQDCPLSTVKTRLYQGLTVLASSARALRRLGRIQKTMCEERTARCLSLRRPRRRRPRGVRVAPARLRGVPRRAEGAARGARGSRRVGAARARLRLPRRPRRPRRRGPDASRRSPRRPSWRAWWTPAAGLAAAAVLVLAAAASLAHVEVHRGPDGITVRTGWAVAGAARRRQLHGRRDAGQRVADVAARGDRAGRRRRSSPRSSAGCNALEAGSSRDSGLRNAST